MELKNRAVFFDRDGVINCERGEYTYRTEDFIVNKGVIELMQKLQEWGFLIFIVSNQGGVAKNIYTKSDVDILHRLFETKAAEMNVKIDDFYYCPHHPYTSKCLCRKPESLLFEKIIALYNISPKSSYMIGDSDRDVEAAQKVGIRGIKVRSNENLLINSEILRIFE